MYLGGKQEISFFNTSREKVSLNSNVLDNNPQKVTEEAAKEKFNINPLF